MSEGGSRAVDEGRAREAADENDQIRARLDKRRKLEDLGVPVYPSSYPVTRTLAEAARAFAETPAEGEVRAAVAGRIVARRGMGRASFLHLQDRSGRLQLYVKEDVVGEEAYGRLALLDLGDFLGATGRMFRTRTGEVTLGVEEWSILGKALRPLPEKWRGLADKEIRFRQRYLDLIVNEEARRVFLARTRIVSAMRRVLDGKGFLEVETPVLQPLYGGASARPFRTTHNALGITLYLRIANELYLKRCLVGGLERVYEFAKCFRNEGMDRSHQPEFTMMECYEAYADYRAGMALTEALVAAAAEAATGALVVPHPKGPIDFTPPWDRVTYFGALERELGADFSDMDEDALRRACEERRIDVPENASAAKLVDALFSETVQTKIHRPTFVIDVPKLLSPLAKGKPGAPHLVERFEPTVAGMEIGNGFSELNDPAEQRARFEEQLALADRDEDTMLLDEPFLRALEHGMPPASGLGIGIDRLVMLLTGQEQIREVVLFPQMRPQAEDAEQ